MADIQEIFMYTRRTANALIPNLMASIVLIAGASAAFAADQPPAAAPSKEMREKMATLHEQMAACLRSDKVISDCRAQMMKECSEQMGQKDCPMMGMHDRMMHEHSDDR
jgi:hypothetical protein